MPILSCPNCGAKNRVDERAADSQPVCGRCGEKLLAEDAPGKSPMTITEASFARDVLGAGMKPVLVDCWAPWCGPCRQLTPTIDRIAAQASGRYAVGKLNVDENPRTARKFHVDSIPTLLIFKNGALVDKLIGLSPANTIAARIKAHL